MLLKIWAGLPNQNKQTKNHTRYFHPATPEQTVGVCFRAHAVVALLLGVPREQEGVEKRLYGGLHRTVVSKRNVPAIFDGNFSPADIARRLHIPVQKSAVRPRRVDVPV